MQQSTRNYKQTIPLINLFENGFSLRYTDARFPGISVFYAALLTEIPCPGPSNGENMRKLAFGIVLGLLVGVLAAYADQPLWQVS
ncbi:MAG TPA: hypothetical protein PKV86_06685, partial [Syntrophobacteraceae bacterium]|nr:hypothetical protein [Syntrophobacteraceae bacterium]